MNYNKFIAEVYDSDKLIHSIECNLLIVNTNNSTSIWGYQEGSESWSSTLKATISDKYIVILKDKK